MTEKTEVIDIVALVNNNPLTKLSNDYGSKIIQKLQAKFTDENQQMFVANFYCYLNYNSKTDFVVNLDRIWKWLGYGRIEECKRVLVKNFKENHDFKIDLGFPQDGGKPQEPFTEPKNLGGRPREYITLTINCFKKLCLKSRTEKADQIHDYYIGLEEIINETVSEQAEELQQKLQVKDKEIEDLKKSNSVELTKLEETLITNSMDKKLVYLGLAEENIVKFGFSKGIEKRVLKDHKREIGPQFTLKYTIITDNHIDLEDLIKNECKREGSVLFGRRISKKYNNKNQTELIQLDSDFTIEKLYDEVLKLKDLCNNDTIKKLIEENKKLRSQVYKEPIKEEILTNSEIKEILSDGIKCTTCSAISEPAKIGINKNTGQYYSQCVDCRKKYSELRLEKNEHLRLQKEKEIIDKQTKIIELRERLLQEDKIVKCFQCKKEKLPIAMGVNKITNQLYKVCLDCRYKKEVNDNIDEKIEDEKTECSKCHKFFESEYNELFKTNYKTCKACREKYQNIKKKDKEEMEKHTENETIEYIECIYCHQDIPKELNAKGDGFYKSCKKCRESRKKYDKKKNEVHKETILAKKKEQYQEKREEIRTKQKEYYDLNRKLILASKAKTIKE